MLYVFIYLYLKLCASLLYLKLPLKCPQAILSLCRRHSEGSVMFHPTVAAQG